MEPIQYSRRAAVLTAFALSLALPLLSGCVALDQFIPKSEEPPTEPVCHVVATWNKEVSFTPDPVRAGQPAPGLTGRVYLFGKEIKCPLVGDGSLAVELFALQPTTGKPTEQGEYKRIERWEIDSATLHRLLRKDPVGWGYTLFLPWGTYRPELTQLKLRLCYQPRNATPLYTESPLSLSRGKGN